MPSYSESGNLNLKSVNSELRIRMRERPIDKYGPYLSIGIIWNNRATTATPFNREMRTARAS
eukprot:11773835-Alexandrium_andersonii.AAC.1